MPEAAGGGTSEVGSERVPAICGLPACGLVSLGTGGVRGGEAGRQTPPAPYRRGHVIDHESYEGPEVAAIINQHFIAIKVDRDERPDVDARYQHAVQAISGQGGGPLTAFHMPDGKVFFGGAYFPPEGPAGRPSFKRVLLSAAQYYRDNREEVEKAAAAPHRPPRQG